MSQARERGRTREAILAGAMRVLRVAGSGASLDAIATETGVSKGGLLYHFSSRDDLLRAVAEGAITTFRARVMAEVDLSENHAGKLLRGYVRALFRMRESDDGFDFPGLWDALSFVDGVTDLLTADSVRWRKEFLADGLHPDRVLIVQNAAEGFIATLDWDHSVTPEMTAHAERTLLALANDNGPLTETGT